VRAVVRLGMAAVALAAAMLSYQSLAGLGELAGYGGLSFLYPIVVDAGAVASCAAWLHTRGRQPLIMRSGVPAHRLRPGLLRLPHDGDGLGGPLVPHAERAASAPRDPPGMRAAPGAALPLCKLLGGAERR
jgi:hypothetical protein